MLPSPFFWCRWLVSKSSDIWGHLTVLILYDNLIIEHKEVVFLTIEGVSYEKYKNVVFIDDDNGYFG